MTTPKTKTLEILNLNIYLDVLKYTEYFPYLSLTESMEVVGDYLVIVIDSSVDEEEVAMAIERHQALEYNYAGLEVEIITNKGNQLKGWIQEFLDETALEHDYDDIKSCRSYTGFDNPFRAECLTLANWCSSIWIQAIVVQQDIMSGNRGFPESKEALIAELPPCPLEIPVT